MAIAFYVDPEYGPLPVAQNDQGQAQMNPDPNPAVADINDEQHQELDNHEMVHHDNQITFTEHLQHYVLHLLNNIYGQMSTGIFTRGQRQVSDNHRRIGGRGQPRRLVSAAVAQDNGPNQNSAQLPDVVTSHAAFSFQRGRLNQPCDLILEAGRNSELLQPAYGDDHHGPLPLTPRSSRAPIVVGLETEFEFKFETCSGDELVGADDNDEVIFPEDFDNLSNAEKGRWMGRQIRELVAKNLDQRSRARRSSFKMSLGIGFTITVPVAALFALGYSFFRR